MKRFMGRFRWGLLSSMLACSLALGGVTYKAKYRIDGLNRDISQLKADIEEEKNTLKLLKADWALLTQPERLKNLIGHYNHQLKLYPINSRQIVTFDDVPYKQSEGDTIENFIKNHTQFMVSTR